MNYLDKLSETLCAKSSSFMLLFSDVGIDPQPVQSKAAPSLPPLVALSCAPFSTFPIEFQEYAIAIKELVAHVLTIPLLPNRLPISSLTTFSARLPISSLQVLSESSQGHALLELLRGLPLESCAHLLANLQAFTPPRYAKITPPAFQAYLALISHILSSIPPGVLSPKPTLPTQMGTKPSLDAVSSSDSEDDGIHVQVVSSFTSSRSSRSKRPELDNKTLTRLGTMVTPSHIASLLNAPAASATASRQTLFSVFLSLLRVFAADRDRVIGSLVAHAQGGLVRELYRGYVRTSCLGKEGQEGALLDNNTRGEWAPLLLLVEIYQRVLLTMGDDEFFVSMRSIGGPSRTAGAGNPLTLDELTGWSRQLLNIAFQLYWRQDVFQAAAGKEGNLVGPAGFSWEEIRDSVTRCLIGIHTRECDFPCSHQR
jgi:ubiquitin-protein ligase E3 C